MMTVKFSKVYKKMILSHTAVILIVSLLMGAASLFYFKWSYDQEIQKYNEQLLDQKKIRFTTSIVNELTENSYSILSNYQGRNEVTKLFDVSLRPSDWRITQAYTYLKNLLLKNGQLIESVSLYCPKNQLFLSTVSGVNHMDLNDTSVQWMVKRMEEYMATGQCIVYDRQIDIYMARDTVPRIMLYASYPLSPLSQTKNSEGLLCLTVRNSFLENLLNNSMAENLTMTFLFDREGNPVNHLTEFPWEVMSSDSFQTKLASGSSFYYKYGGSSYVISQQSADSADSSVPTGFLLVNVSPTDSFYGRSTYYILFWLFVCTAAIAIGVFVSWRFSKNLYQPLKETVTKISEDIPASAADNEYILINDYISQLHQKASGNLELIYRTVIRNLLTVPLDAREIEKQLFSAGIDFAYPLFMVCAAEPDQEFCENGSALSLLEITNEITELSDSTIRLHAVLLEERQFGIIINGSSFPSDLIQRIFNVILENCGVNGKIFYSSSFQDVDEIQGYYAMLLRMRRYKYFFPDRIFFDLSDFYKKDMSLAHISTGISANLASLLRNRKTAEIEVLLAHMRNDIQEHDYSFESCHTRITKMIYLLSEYIREIHLEKEFPPEVVHNTLSSLPDIDIFTKNYLETVEAVYQMLDSRSQSQNMDVVRRIQEYILENLQSDISLDDAARLVSLSPQYVSRLFRDGIGITFVAFIKKCKMEKAKELLRQHDKNVDQVALELGYNSTAYFIKNFKDTYGITPKAYQRQTF